MKLNSIKKALGNFRSFMPEKNVICFQSRANLNKIVKVVIQENSLVVLPIRFEDDREVVAFHVKTIKSLVNFLGE